MRALAVLLLVACSSKSPEPTASGSAPTPEPKGSATTPPAGSGTAATPPAGSGTAVTPPAGSGSGSGSAIAAGSGSAAAFDFDKLTHQEQIDFMKKKVVPTMKPLFQDFDKKKYAVFGCKTCHGKDAQKVKFKMPNGELPKLDFAALKAGKQKPDIAKWMGEVIKPQMAKLLQEPEMTETNPKGFGCLECHDQKK